MIYIIHNDTTGQIEGAYMSDWCADSMIKNLNNYYKGKFKFSLEIITTPRNRPTTPQWNKIHEIEIKTLKHFNGITHEAANKFINENK
jgi:hypothetical protein